MEFDINRVYTAVNADELKVGSKVIVADTLCELKKKIEEGRFRTLTNVYEDACIDRFEVDSTWSFPLAYLVSKAEEKKLKWTDLKIGDVIRNKNGRETRLVVGISKAYDNMYIFNGTDWLTDKELEEWEKVEE